MLQAVYDAIVQYYRSYGVPPTCTRVGELCGLASTNTVHYYIGRLVALKLVVKVDRHPVPVEVQNYLQHYTPKKESCNEKSI